MGGSSANAPPAQGEYLSRKLAMQVQSDLDEYLTNNPEFPVCTAGYISEVSVLMVWCRLRRDDQGQSFS
jgi:hypothetical protein